MTVTEQAFAKINLGLDVIGRRADGYHDLISVMQTLSLCDTLEFRRVDKEGVFLGADEALPTDDNNLIVRAAKAYFMASGRRFGVEVQLEKRIPMQAGMGGGSADAAATLRALDRMSDTPLGERALCEIGARIGADVPFCVCGGTRLCRGIGEQMQAVPNRLQSFAVVAMDGEGVSTPRAFAALDEKYGDFAFPAAEAEMRFPLLLGALECGDCAAFASAVYNRFEDVIEPARPAVARLKKKMMESGAFAARMSGSGPSVYGLFLDRAMAEATADRFAQEGILAVACTLV